MRDESGVRAEIIRKTGRSPERLVEERLDRTGKGVLDWLVRHLSEFLGIRYVFVGEVWGADWDRVRMLALAAGEPIEYDLRGTPCSKVVERHEICVYPCDVARLFPKDPELVRMGAESYAAVPLIDDAGRPLGLLAAIHTQPFTPEQARHVEDTLEFWRPRAHAELRLRRAEQDLVRIVPESAGPPTLSNLCEALAQAMHVRAVFVAEPVDEEGDLVTKAYSVDGKATLPARFSGAAGSCPKLAEKDGLICGQEQLEWLLGPGVSESLPFAVEGFVGICLERGGRRPALLGLIHDRPIAPGMASSPVLRSFAQRMQGELARQRLERERMQMERELLTASTRESLGALARGIAHDFNNLLVNILGNTELLRAELPAGEAHDYADEAHRAAEQAALLCRRILSYSSSDGHAHDALDIVHLTRDVSQLSAAGHPIACELLLASDSEIMVESEPAELSQVIMNLVRNALEAAALTQGGVRVQVSSERLERADIRAATIGSERAPGLYACVRVEDDGPGMDADTCARIFDAFYTTKKGGHGLGLAGLRDVAEHHRAVVMLRSAPGEGTSFTFALPLAAGSSARVSRPTPTPAPAVERGYALVVDDQDMVARVAKRMLQRLGFSVVVASDGESALVETESQEFELALVDLSMPGMPGDVLAVELRRRFPKLPIVLSSGFSDAADLPHEARACIDAVLPKPYGFADVVGVVERAASPNEPQSETSPAL